jgi:hypothetical protein
MKKTIIVTTVCCLVFGAFVLGQQNTKKEKHIEPCCCKHTQQIAEDLHWFREQMEKPFISPGGFKDPGGLINPSGFKDPGNPDDLPPLKVPKFNFPKPKN